MSLRGRASPVTICSPQPTSRVCTPESNLPRGTALVSPIKRAYHADQLLLMGRLVSWATRFSARLSQLPVTSWTRQSHPVARTPRSFLQVVCANANDNDINCVFSFTTADGWHTTTHPSEGATKRYSRRRLVFVHLGAILRFADGVFVCLHRRLVDVVLDVDVRLPVERRSLVTCGRVFPPTTASAS